MAQALARVMEPESQGPDPPPPQGICLRVRCSETARALAGVGEVLPSLRPLSPAASGGGHRGPEPRDSAARGRLRPTPPVPRPPRAGLNHPSRAPGTTKDHATTLRARFPRPPGGSGLHRLWPGGLWVEPVLEEPGLAADREQRDLQTGPMWPCASSDPPKPRPSPPCSQCHRLRFSHTGQ